MSAAVLAYAITLGLIAAVNPCGFPLLPAYLVSFTMADAPGARRAAVRRAAVVRALRAGACVTAGFVVTFGVVGAAVSAGAALVIAWVPWIMVVVGAAMVALGVLVLIGRWRGLALPATPFRRGCGALAMVGDVYKVGARLEPSSRTLIRAMIAKSVQRSALEAAGFVLDHATVSAEARRSFARLLAEPAGGRAGARRLVLTESAGFFQSARGIATFSTLSPRLPSRESWPLYIERCANTLILKITLNPQATANRLNEAMEGCSFSAETRELGGLEGMEEKLDADLFGHFQVKNLSGRLLIPMAVPHYAGLVRTYWETEDRRAALLKRLGEPPAATFTYSLPEGTCRAGAGV